MTYTGIEVASMRIEVESGMIVMASRRIEILSKIIGMASRRIILSNLGWYIMRSESKRVTMSSSCVAKVSKKRHQG